METSKEKENGLRENANWIQYNQLLAVMLGKQHSENLTRIGSHFLQQPKNIQRTQKNF